MRVVTPLPRAAARPPESINPLVLASLAQPSAYPKDASAAAGLEHIETPLSHLFLTRERVYKLRKSVDFGSADLTTRRKRNSDCVREVQLNRRLAPDVYLGVAPLVQGPESFVLGALVGTSPSVLPDAAEHCVVMRRLPAGRDALGLLKAGRLTTRHVAAMAARVASFHQRNRLSPRRLGSDRAILRRVTQPFHECIRALEVAHPSPEVEATLRVIDGLARAFLEARAADVCRRARSRRWVDGHGDLRLSHVWFEHDRDVPAVTDCLEFDDELRHMDAASDLAFLAMDLAYRGREKLAEQLLSRYANATDDFDLFWVVDFFQGYRALVRARVAAFGSADSALGWDDPRATGYSVERYLALAERMLRWRSSGSMILLCGRAGTGKSTVAEFLSEECGGILVSFDRLQGKLGGSSGEVGTGAPLETEVHSADRASAIYEGMLERAAPVVASGRLAILDAGFGTVARRDCARRWAREHGASVFLIELECQESTARERLARRRAEGESAWNVEPGSPAEGALPFEPPGEWPRETRLRLRTDAPSWRYKARRKLRSLCGRELGALGTREGQVATC